MKLTRRECKAEESNFLARFERHFETLKSVYNPLDNATYDTRKSVRRETDSTNELRALIRREVEPSLQTELYNDMPKNNAVIFDILKTSFFGGSRPAVALCAAFVGDLQELARSGETSPPAGVPRLNELKSRIVLNPKVFCYITAYSPTGWVPEARQHLSGPNFVIGLADGYGGGPRVYVPPETRIVSRRVFDLCTFPEKTLQMKQLVKDAQFELIMDDFTETLAAERLCMDPNIVVTLFEEILPEDRFVILDARARPMRLIREYSRPTFLPQPEDPEVAQLVKFRDMMIRDEERIACVIRDLETLNTKERELIDEGASATVARRQFLAHVILEIRERRRLLESRLQIYQKRRKIAGDFVSKLQMLTELKAEPVPDSDKIEEVYTQAAVERDKLKELAEMADAAQTNAEKSEEPQDTEIGGILKELGSETEEEKPEIKSEPPHVEERPPEKHRDQERLLE